MGKEAIKLISEISEMDVSERDHIIKTLFGKNTLIIDPAGEDDIYLDLFSPNTGDNSSGNIR
ncbi:hypothetical protein SAMN05661091_2954 [Paenibacillus uliginis N3/975]|uniref:Uncharacterized protein n=1 Tax=Paenibacillus uliginis N3/975 TaxID=1313296 RepID=A0A1X7HEU0_9BACL|nr:hypothetical protein [Paenibacillus uliginis]SMF85300.1 hypothetical protein SAMN05661091_2954 [Paenibacillus uliginis N3/975]